MKKVLAIILAVVMIVSLAACGSKSGSTAGGKADSAGSISTDPIHIGVVWNQASANSPISIDIIEGYLADMDNKVSGREIVIHTEDTEGNPSVAVEKLIKCVDQYGCKFIIGPNGGAEGTAIKEYAENYLEDVTIIVTSAGASQITYDTPANLFRVCASGAQAGFGLGQYAYEVLGYRKALTVASDYDFTFSQVAGFIYGFVAAGGEIIDRVWFTNNTTDYSSTLASIAQVGSNYDVIFCGAGAGDSLYFVQQYHDFGMTVPLLGGSNFTDPSCLTSDIGDYYLGCITSSYYADGYDSEEYRSFIENYYRWTGLDETRTASSFNCDAYVAVEVVCKAIEAVNGNVEDQAAVQAAVAALSFETPHGPLSFDENHALVCDIFITEVAKDEKGVNYNKVIDTVSNVSQSGPFDYEWYKAQPEPDRKNPAIEDIANAVYSK